MEVVCSEKLNQKDFNNKYTSELEADENEFKSLKGIAGKWLDIDEIRKERLKL